MKNIISVVNQFNISGDVIDIHPFGEGHINSTFLIVTVTNQYILQKINNSIFTDVEALMNNINIVTSFISSKGEETINIIPTKNGKLYVKENDEYFRMMEFVKNTVCYQKADNLKLVRSEGEAFGELHYLLSDLDANKVVEVIPDFHNTQKRYENFLKALENTSEEKKRIAKEEISFILKEADTYSLINKEIEKGNVKLHIIHNDTKINNILFDKDTGLYRCVIDLDRMMPGSILYDIGDALRSLFTGENEDSKDLSKLKVDFDVYETFVKAYLGKMKDALTDTEIELIPFSVYLLTIELAIRFLEDYLNGNKYFHVDYEDHNLVRARTQIALSKDVLNNMDKLKEITK